MKPDLNRKVEAHAPLPDFVGMGYYFLGKDWLETANKWKEGNVVTPPAMITVANITHICPEARGGEAAHPEVIRFDGLSPCRRGAAMRLVPTRALLGTNPNASYVGNV